MKMNPSTLQIPAPLDKQSDESHSRDYHIGEFVGKNVKLYAQHAEIRGAALIDGDLIIEHWEPEEPLVCTQRTELGLCNTTPLVAKTVRLYHKPNDQPSLTVGTIEFMR